MSGSHCQSITRMYPEMQWSVTLHHYYIILLIIQLAFTVYDIYGPRKAIPVGGTVVTVFGKHG